VGDKVKGGPSDYSLGTIVAIFFLIASESRVERWFRVWIKTAGHRRLLALAFVAVATPLFYWIARKRELHVERRKRDEAVLGPAAGAVYCGLSRDKKPVFVKERQRAMHTQVIGTTNAGKTESVILPWAIQDIEQGRGLILIDGKADSGLLDKLWAYSVKAGRRDAFRLFSISNLAASHQFNPLIGGSPEEVSERVFNAFDFENQHYRSLQYEIFSQVMRVFAGTATVPTFLRLHQAVTEPVRLEFLASKLKDEDLKGWVTAFRDLPVQERAQRTSGLSAALSHFAFGATGCLFNTEDPSITMEKALNEDLIVYFQLPVLLSPFLGKASGKMILQCLQSAVANRHRGKHEAQILLGLPG
jgi:hypothetical protein